MTGGEGLLYGAACLIVWFFVYSFAGWLWEVAYSLVKHGRFVNRGFLYGPLCPIYGAGALLGVVAVGPIGNPLLQFVLGGLLAGILEFATSWAMERLFHARWWDYTGYFCNIQGRVCLLGVVVFGFMTLLVNHAIQPLLARATSMLDPPAVVALAAVLLALLAADFAASVAHMRGFNDKLEFVQGCLGNLAQEALLAADRARESIGEGVDQARARAVQAAASGRERIGAVVGHARSYTAEASERLGDLKEAAVEGLHVLRDSSLGAEFAGRVERLRDLMPRPSRFERKTLRDARFMPTRNAEALEWLRELLNRGADGAAGEDGGHADGDRGRLP